MFNSLDEEDAKKMGAFVDMLHEMPYECALGTHFDWVSTCDSQTFKSLPEAARLAYEEHVVKN